MEWIVEHVLKNIYDAHWAAAYLNNTADRVPVLDGNNIVSILLSGCQICVFELRNCKGVI